MERARDRLTTRSRLMVKGSDPGLQVGRWRGRKGGREAGREGLGEKEVFIPGTVEGIYEAPPL